jgi:hypothetical protein
VKVRDDVAVAESRHDGGQLIAPTHEHRFTVLRDERRPRQRVVVAGRQRSGQLRMREVKAFADRHVVVLDRFELVPTLMIFGNRERIREDARRKRNGVGANANGQSHGVVGGLAGTPICIARDMLPPMKKAPVARALP